MTDHRDQKLRELTFKLINMAPKAPPFPEAPMTTLKPQKSPALPGLPPGRRNLTPLVVAAGAFALALLVALPIVLLGGGDPGPAGPATTVPPATSSVPPAATIPTDVTLFFLADYVAEANLPGPHLIPMRRTVDVAAEPGDDIVRAAVMALLAGPDSADAALVESVSSSIPGDSRLLGYSLDQAGGLGRLTLDFSGQFEAGGGSFAMSSRLAQVVYTATQFPEVDDVVFAIEGEVVTVFSGEGIVLSGPQDRAGYRDVLPLIFVETPLPGETISSPVAIAGVANTFEAGLQYRVETSDGTLLAKGFTTATCGTGCWGDFAESVDYTIAGPSEGVVLVFESSAEDGRQVNVVRIPVMIVPGERDPGTP